MGRGKKNGPKSARAAVFLILGVFLAAACVLFLKSEGGNEINPEVLKESPKERLPEDTGAVIREQNTETDLGADPAAVEAAAMEQEFQRILNLSAGEFVCAGMAREGLLGRLFYAAGINEAVLARISGKSYTQNETVLPSDLSYLRMLYYGPDGNTYLGEMIVNQAIEADILDIFQKLYENRYPIERMVLVDEYDADDEASMQANNTSAFNYRTIAGSSRLSNHSYGLAVDLNPKYNPYVKEASDGSLICQPQGSEAYADRAAEFAYKIDEQDLAYRLFTEAGFTWGGDFNSVKDYQHFEMPY